MNLDDLTKDERRRYLRLQAFISPEQAEQYARETQQERLESQARDLYNSQNQQVAAQQGGGVSTQDTQDIANAPTPKPAPKLSSMSLPGLSQRFGTGGNLYGTKTAEAWRGEDEKQKKASALRGFTFGDEKLDNAKNTLLDAGMIDEAATLVMNVSRSAGSGFAGKSAIAYDLIKKMEAMPDGPEKNAERSRLIQAGYITASGYGLTPEGTKAMVDQRYQTSMAGASGSVQGRVDTEAKNVSTIANTESTIAAAKAGASEKGREAAQQDILTGEMIPGLEPIPNVRQTEDSIKKVKEARPRWETIRTLTDKLVTDYDQNGFSPMGAKAADYQSTVQQLRLEAKEAFNLGVLNGPDMSLLEQIINDPSSWKSGAQSLLRYGFDNIGTRLNNVKDLFESKEISFYRANGFRPKVDEGTSAPQPTPQPSTTTQPTPRARPTTAATPKPRKRYNPATGKFEEVVQ